MSGILCVYSASGIEQDLPRYLSALRRLTHRGLDGEGAILQKKLFLGVELAAIGSAAAKPQPLAGADGKFVVALDGHVHERESLADTLRSKGHSLNAPSDAELLLGAYVEFGEGCFEKLKGVWAVVLWDERLNRLIISRDRLGVRPLYYFSDGRRFVIASEIKSILSLEAAARAVNYPRVREFIQNGAIDDWADTFFAAIRPVPPGTFLRIDGREPVTTRFWNLRSCPRANLSQESILDKLVTAVDRHTPKDISVGIALSGGIDSSSIVGIFANSRLRGSRDIRAFSFTPPETTDESFLVNATVRHTGIPHSYVDLGDLDYPRLLLALLEKHDEPIQYSGVFYQFILRQRIAEAGCKAVLVGYGADEIFSGYDFLAMPFLASLMTGGRLLDSIRFTFGAREFLQMPATQILEKALRRAFAETVKRLVGEERFRRWRPADRAEAAPTMLLPDVGQTARASTEIDYQFDPYPSGQAFFRELLQCFRRNIALLVRLEDRNAMAHGLELCVPFMDHELVEAALGMPYHRFMAGGRNKAFLRNAVHSLLAPEVNQFPKKLVTPGSDAYVAFEALRPQFLDMLSSTSFYATGFWSRGCGELYALDAAQKTRAGHWFRVYMVQQWYENVVRSVVADPTAVGTKP